MGVISGVISWIRSAVFNLVKLIYILSCSGRGGAYIFTNKVLVCGTLGHKFEVCEEHPNGAEVCTRCKVEKEWVENV